MRDSVKRLMAGIMTAVMLMAMLSGCKKDENNKENNGDNVSSVSVASDAINEQSENAYVAEFIPVPITTELHNLATNLLIASDTLYIAPTEYITSYYDYNGKQLEVTEVHGDIYSMNVNGTGFAKLENYVPAMTVPADAFSISGIEAMHIDKTGNIWVVESWNFFRYDIPPGHSENIREIWELWEFNETVDKGCAIRKLDATGAEVLSIDISSVSEQEEYFFVEAFYVDDSQNIYLSYRVLDTGGQFIYLVDNADGSMHKIGTELATDQFVQLPDGSVAFPSLAVDEDGNQFQALQVIDVPGKKLGEPILLHIGEDLLISQGGGEFDLFAAGHQSLYGLSIGDAEPVKLLDWGDIDIGYTGYRSISNFVACPGGRIICTNTDFTSPGLSTEIVILTKMARQEIPENAVLTLGVAGYGLGPEMSNYIAQFNRTNQEYRVEVIDYSEYNTENTFHGGLDRFALDITSGKIPDIISTSFLPYEEYADMGLFTDLYPFIDSDPDYGRGDFVEGVFEAVEIGGCLYQVFPYFNIYTLVGNPSVLGPDMGWNIYDFEEVLAGHPEADMPLGANMTKTIFLSNGVYFGWDDYVDWGTGTVRFDSGEFLKLLELANTFPEDVDWDNYAMDDEAIYNGRMIGGLYYVMHFNHFPGLKSMFGGEIILKGFPAISQSGHILGIDGGLAIAENSAKKEAAWSFVRNLLDKDAQLLYGGQFPSNLAAFSQMAEEEIRKGVIYGETDLTAPFTEDDLNQITALLASDSAGTYNYANEDLWYIISEEASQYFSGVITAQDAAGRIQSRALMFVSERMR